ncbi:DUF6332 family protein [Streptomyces sioyaensis]|uniref:DUF6332 family protein n=1 Tax=Streptomyces sioyaensis TaxID=67364 RepID=UPI003F53E6B2
MEIVFALVTGAVIAALLFFAISFPAFVWKLSGGWKPIVLGLAAAISAAGFLYRVVSVLSRLRKAMKKDAEGFSE